MEFYHVLIGCSALLGFALIGLVIVLIVHLKVTYCRKRDEQGRETVEQRLLNQTLPHSSSNDPNPASQPEPPDRSEPIYDELEGDEMIENSPDGSLAQVHGRDKNSMEEQVVGTDDDAKDKESSSDHTVDIHDPLSETRHSPDEPADDFPADPVALNEQHQPPGVLMNMCMSSLKKMIEHFQKILTLQLVLLNLVLKF